MVGRPYDCLVNPLGAVRLTFEKAVSAGADPTTLAGRDWGATDLFQDFLLDDGAFSQVPLLGPTTSHTVQPNTLVRFRGMIQDMLGNEFYVGAYKDGGIWNTNKYTDISHSPIGSSSSDTLIWERRLLYCVPVPGQSMWTKSGCESVINQSTNMTSPPQREKRQREDGAASDTMDVQATNHETEESPCPKKMREDGFPAQCSSHPGGSRTEEVTSDSTMVGQNYLPCLVKIYDSPESDLKLNDVFEFFGVLTFDPEFAADKNNSSDELANEFYEDALVHLPPSKVPRLHCILHRKLAVHDFLPSSPVLEPKLDLVRGIREALLSHLTAVLGNDGLAANFMLLHLLSRVHTRTSSIAVGKLSMNLTCFSKESMSIFGNCLKLAIKNLLPFTHCIPLTVDYLNNASLAPRKDYELNRLVTGVLQLAEGSHLTIDETKLQTGTLNSTGVENTRLLRNLMEFQKVEYDFKYYKMEMESDAQMLILSEGKSNILPADLVVPFRPSSVDSYEILNAEETFKAWRWYLATLRSLPHSIGPEMQKVVEDDLVAARQADRSLGSEDFSRWLTMGRLMSMSCGETSLSMEHWQMVKELERLRRVRFQ